MASIFDFKTPEQLIQERRAARGAQLQSVFARNAATQPNIANQAAADVGSLLGSYIGRKLNPVDEGEDIERARQQQQDIQSAYIVPTVDRQQTTTPQGGIVTQETPLSLADQRMQQSLNLRDYAFKYPNSASGTAALNLSMQLEQQAFKIKEEAKQKQAQEAYLKTLDPEQAAFYRAGGSIDKLAPTDEDTLKAKDVADLYKDFTPTSIAAHQVDSSNPLVPIKEEGFTPESQLGKLAKDLDNLKKLPSTPSNLSAIASIQKEINSEQVQYDTQLRELSGNIVKDFAGKGNASEIVDWNYGVNLTSNLMAYYGGNPSKVRAHLNKYYEDYSKGRNGFDIKEEYKESTLTTPDGRAYYFDPQSNQFIEWVN